MQNNQSLDRTKSLPDAGRHACPSVAHAQTKLIEQAGYPVPDLSNILNLIAEQAGFFKEEGLQVEVRYSTGGPQATQITASGGADVGQVTQEPPIEGYEKGIRGKIFYTQFTRLIYHLPSRQTVRSNRSPTSRERKSACPTWQARRWSWRARHCVTIRCRSKGTRFVRWASAMAPSSVADGQVQALSMWTAAYASMMRAGIDFPLPLSSDRGRYRQRRLFCVRQGPGREEGQLDQVRAGASQGDSLPPRESGGRPSHVLEGQSCRQGGRHR